MVLDHYTVLHFDICFIAWRARVYPPCCCYIKMSSACSKHRVAWAVGVSRAHALATKMMCWALARVSFRAAKIVSCNNKKMFMVYDRIYFNCSTLLVI
jgi:hypothetical protein